MNTQTGNERDVFAEFYPAIVHAIYVAAGEEDFGGVADDDLPAHYEQVMGRPFEWRETNPTLPAPLNLTQVNRLFGTSRRKREEERKRGGDLALSDGDVVKRGVDRWVRRGGVSGEEALDHGDRYRCPACGPVRDVLHGSDERLHCLECDAPVDAALPRWEAEGLSKIMSQRRQGMAYPKIKCIRCEREFQRLGIGQAKRIECYACKPRGKAHGRGKAGAKAAAPKRPEKKAAPKPTKKTARKVSEKHVAKSQPSIAETVERNGAYSDRLQRLRAEAAAVVSIAEAIEGLNGAQVERVLRWVQEARR